MNLRTWFYYKTQWSEDNLLKKVCIQKIMAINWYGNYYITLWELTLELLNNKYKVSI